MRRSKNRCETHRARKAPRAGRSSHTALLTACPRAPFFSPIPQVLLAGERMGQTAVEAEMRSMTPGVNPLRALLPADSTASAKAAAELIIETATAQFEEKRGPKAVDAMVAMSELAAQQGGQRRDIGPELPPPLPPGGKATVPAAANRQSDAPPVAATKPKAASVTARVGGGKAKVSASTAADTVPLPADGPLAADDAEPASSTSTAAGAASGPSGDAASAPSSEEQEDDEGAAALQQATWAELGLALWHEWASVLAEALSFVPELFGWCGHFSSPLGQREGLCSTTQLHLSQMG